MLREIVSKLKQGRQELEGVEGMVTRLGDRHEWQSQMSQLEKTVSEMQVQQLILQQSFSSHWQQSLDVQRSEA